MSRKKIILATAVALGITATIAGYYNYTSSNDVHTDNVIDKSAADLLERAISLYEKENPRGTETIYKSQYDDGSVEEEKELIIYDSTHNLIKTTHEYSDGETYENILSSEDGTVYSYIKDSTRDENWIRYPEISDENNETSFDYLLQELDFSISEENGYSNISISKEGEEILNGTQSIKLKVSATLEATDGTEEADSSDKVTREDIIKENEWTEESVMAVNGFSKLLDDYVDYLNEPIAFPDATEEECIIWIDAETYSFIQIEGTINTNYIEETSSKIETEFWEKCWEVSWIQADLDSGVSLEDSLATLEDERKNIEAQMQDDLAGNESENEKELSLQKMSYIQTFLTGASCPSIDTLPTDYKETTQEDYYNEYTEEDTIYVDGEYLDDMYIE